MWPGLAKVTAAGPCAEGGRWPRAAASRTEIASISGGSPHRLAPEHDAGLRGARSSSADLEYVGQLRPRRQLVGGRAGGRDARPRSSQSSSSIVSQPIALDEAAFDLAAIDDRRNGVADVLQDVGAEQAVTRR